MKLIPIINRIKAQCPSFNNNVEPAKSLEALPDDVVKNNLPMAFVYSAADDSGGFETMQGDQQHNDRFGVIIVCENISLISGAESLEDLKTELRTALKNYEITATDYAPISWAGGRMLSVSNRMVWWVDTFETFIYP